MSKLKIAIIIAVSAYTIETVCGRLTATYKRIQKL